VTGVHATQRLQEGAAIDAMFSAGIVNGVETGDRAADASHPEVEKDADGSGLSFHHIGHQIIESNRHVYLHPELTTTHRPILCRSTTFMAGAGAGAGGRRFRTGEPWRRQPPLPALVNDRLTRQRCSFRNGWKTFDFPAKSSDPTPTAGTAKRNPPKCRGFERPRIPGV
jgi:hypothetical protein